MPSSLHVERCRPSHRARTHAPSPAADRAVGPGLGFDRSAIETSGSSGRFPPQSDAGGRRWARHLDFTTDDIEGRRAADVLHDDLAGVPWRYRADERHLTCNWMEISVDAGRVRHRQGSASLVNGVPYSNRETTLSLLPGAVVGRWLADNADAVSGLLLDLGAGNQPFKVWYSGLAEKCVSVDVTPAPGLDVLSLAAPLPFRSAAFDTVLCTQVLEHVHDAEAVVSEIARILKPGGRVIITIPFLYPTHEAPFDFWRTTHLGLRSVLTRHGLEVDTVAAQGGPGLLVSHYMIAGFAQLVMLIAKRLGRFGPLVDNRLVRALIATPQDLVRTRLSYRLTPASRAASLGYMAVARKPE